MSKTSIARRRRSQVHISIKSTDNDSHRTTPPPTIRTPSSAVCAVLCGARGAMPGHSSVRLFIRTELEAAQKRYRHSHRLPPSHPKPVFSTVLVQLPSSLMSDTAESRPYRPETREASQLAGHLFPTEQSPWNARVLVIHILGGELSSPARGSRGPGGDHDDAHGPIARGRFKNLGTRHRHSSTYGIGSSSGGNLTMCGLPCCPWGLVFFPAPQTAERPRRNR
jgi:hypothetical protein